MKAVFNKKIKRHFELLLKKQKKDWPVNFVIHITHRRKNVFLTFTDFDGHVFFRQSFGLAGFEGANKGTDLAKKVTVANFIQQIREMSIFLSELKHQKRVALYSNALPGTSMRWKIIEVMQELYNVVSINETVPIPHNGCRVRKQRRI